MCKRKISKIFIIVLTMIFFNCSGQNNKNSMKDRQPYAAGKFYEADSSALIKDLQKLFSYDVAVIKKQTVLAIISPHASYAYSGKVAASAFKQIDYNKKYDNIFILGPSHQYAFSGASIYSAGDYITPLGKVKVNTKLAKDFIRDNNVFHFYPNAHRYEHSIEVQLPFLQYLMKKDFQIIPIVVGSGSTEDCKRIAKALKPYFNENNLFIISTDFSHYPSYNEAIINDSITANSIMKNSAKELLKILKSNTEKGYKNLVTSLCGRYAVLTLLYITESDPDINITPILNENSGDYIYGDKNRVVGYYSIAFSKNLKKINKMEEFTLTIKDKKDLLQIARKTINEYIRKGRIYKINPSSFSDNIKKHCGAFVTLHKNGRLRGCIGRFIADEPLYKIVQQMAIASSTQDYRFPKVRETEIDDLEIEISVLSPLRKIDSIDEIQLGKHGIYIKKGMASGTFLPQVATETGWNKEEFLGHCSRDKAGIGWDGWRDAEIFIYDAIVFDEKIME